MKAGFGTKDFHNTTTLHPLGLAAILVLGLATLMLPRKYAIYPMIVMACFISPAQRIVIATLDFSLLRIMVLFGWARVLMRGEHRGFKWKRMDHLVVAWTVISALVNIVQRGNVAGFIFQGGQAYDMLGMYALFRILIRGWGDADRVVRFVILCSIPVAALFLVEKTTGKNPFAMMGGVPSITVERQGRLRCQGPFKHAILAGCFWVAWLPFVVSRWWRPKGKLEAVVGSITILLIVFACSSSTPVVGLLASGIGLAAWLVRRQMRVVRWGILATLVGLHMVMNAPVWHLISRISLTKGNTGYHRFRLIDNAIKRFDEWWLIGTKSTAHWGHAMYDLTNQYVREGVKGGFISLVLFVWVLVEAYSRSGRLWKKSSRQSYPIAFAWGMGVCLFAHTIMFLSISISHSQQNMLVMFFLFALAAGLEPRRRRKVQLRALPPREHLETQVVTA